MPEPRILVVDDEVGMLEVCRDTLRDLPGARVAVESEPARAAERLAEGGWDLLITDLRMPGIDGLDLLRLARRADAALPVLMLTAFPSVETAVESMKLGAADYLTKPFLPDDLLLTARRLLEGRRAGAERRPPAPAPEPERGPAFGDMVGISPAMRAVFDCIEKIAAADVDVLITGETGTGKELVARSIHQRSARAGKRFVPVDCGAIPEDLLESEFFGHEKGAFTGAATRSLGLLEFAQRGTLFLDEVGHLPQRLQAKLLRVLQERRVRRVGGTQEFEVDVRVLAATSLDLEKEAREERFRPDLLYRIHVAHVRLPPLRERDGDIPLLVAHFAERYAREMGREGVEVDPGALEVLCGYRWPGNVRELQNVLKRAIAMSRGPVIGAGDLPDAVVAEAAPHPGAGAPPGFFALRERQVAAFEREYLERLLRAAHGNVSHAAAEARLPRWTFYRLCNRHELDPAAFRE